MMHAESTSIQKPTALPENNWFPAVIFFQNGVVAAAGIVPTFPCRQQQRMPGKYIRVVVLREERVCEQLHGVLKIKRLLISKYAESAVIASKIHHPI
ncbi:hypothetical protein OCP70_001562 [Salmonella enterica]|nr:hypothetical protein [Salmonella enterica]EJW6911281.1 hypothetical protein [Salmonella enterica]